jgi:hypothetical protein
VTVQILKPTDARQYADTMGDTCRFEAEWMRNTGLFIGEQVGGNPCFYPEKTFSRGEFLAMVVKVLEIPLENTASIQLPDNTPHWLIPYVAAAQRSGLLTNLETAGAFDRPITGAEAAVILQNALDLTVSSTLLETAQTFAGEALSAREAACIAVMAENGVNLSADSVLTRGETAQVLYRISKIAPEAPGMAIFRMQH